MPQGFVQTFPLHPVPAIFPPPPGGDVHQVFVTIGEVISGLDFGNRQVDSGFVSGINWQDFNANGELDPQEVGLGGVTIYADYNFNGVLDVGEPSTVTMFEIPETDFDEGGSYFLEARPGFTAIRQVVPLGHVQTFPISDAASPLEQGAHFVNIESGTEIPNLDFGNFPLDVPPGPIPGDLNGDGLVDDGDLDHWEQSFGLVSITLDAVEGGSEMDGRSFLDWQRNVTPPAPLAAAVIVSSTDVPAVNLDGSPVGTSSSDSGRPLARTRQLVRESAFSELSTSTWAARESIDSEGGQDTDAVPTRSHGRAAARRAAFRDLGTSVGEELNTRDWRV